MQLSEQGRQRRERKCPIFKKVAKWDLTPGSLDCDSGTLPRSVEGLLIQILVHCAVLGLVFPVLGQA